MLYTLACANDVRFILWFEIKFYFFPKKIYALRLSWNTYPHAVSIVLVLIASIPGTHCKTRQTAEVHFLRHRRRGGWFWFALNSLSKEGGREEDKEDRERRLLKHRASRRLLSPEFVNHTSLITLLREPPFFKGIIRPLACAPFCFADTILQKMTSIFFKSDIICFAKMADNGHLCLESQWWLPRHLSPSLGLEKHQEGTGRPHVWPWSTSLCGPKKIRLSKLSEFILFHHSCKKYSHTVFIVPGTFFKHVGGTNYKTAGFLVSTACSA